MSRAGRANWRPWWTPRAPSARAPARAPAQGAVRTLGAPPCGRGAERRSRQRRCRAAPRAPCRCRRATDHRGRGRGRASEPLASHRGGRPLRRLRGTCAACPPRRHRADAGGAERNRTIAEEVRRLYPFFPVIGGRVLRTLRLARHPLRRGEWLLLDLYGTNRDPRAWPRPTGSGPSGMPGPTPEPSGDGAAGRRRPAAATHRCPGEWLTAALMTEAIGQLSAMDYSVPEQDLAIPTDRLPALAARRHAHRRRALRTGEPAPSPVIPARTSRRPSRRRRPAWSHPRARCRARRYCPRARPLPRPADPARHRGSRP